MKDYSTKDIRNVVLLGSTKSGKTTLAEAMLYEGKVIDRRGTVEDKNTVSDNDELEKLNQRSIYATPLYAEFQGTKINFIDAPGSDDFIGGAYSAFRVCESGILVVNAQQGVEVGTENFVRRAEENNLPMFIAVNQLDTDKADWVNVQASMKEALGGKLVYVQFPTATGAGFDGIIDVLTMKYYHFKDANGACEVLDIPAQFADQAEDLALLYVEAGLADGLVDCELAQLEILAEVLHLQKDFPVFHIVCHQFSPPFLAILSLTISGISTLGAFGCSSHVAA